jgi:histidinol-phosphate aminotransferase
VLADFGAPARADAADLFLRGRGIIVRRVGGYGLPSCLRITIGLVDENDSLMAALAAFQAGANG